MQKENKPEESHDDIFLDTPNSKSKPKTKKGLIVTLIILLVLALGGIAGTWYYMNQQLTNQKNQNQAAIDELNNKIRELEAAKNAKTDNAEKSYKTKYELLNFKYPENFTLTDQSSFSEETNSGGDSINIKSPDGFTIDLLTGVTGIGGNCNECTVLKSEPITILGKQYFLNYIQDTTDGTGVSSIVFAEKEDSVGGGTIDARNALQDGTEGKIGLILINAGYRNGDNQVAKSLSSIQSDPNIQAYKNFLQSLSY